MEIVKGPVIDRADAMSDENGTVVVFCLFKVCDYHQTNLFVRSKQNEDPDILLRDSSLLHVTSLCALFRMYGFVSSRGKLSVSFILG